MPGQKTINIVYNVDTQSIQSARDQVTQAKNATDQLTQSSQRFGSVLSSSAQTSAATITALKDKMAILKEQIEDTNRSDVAALNARIAKYKEMQAELDKFNQSLQVSKKNTDEVGNSLTSLAGIVRTVITAGILKETVSATLAMAKLSGQIDGVKRAFDKLPNSVLLMQELREKTHGTIDELTLMQKAVQAQNFKIPLEQLGTLLEFVAIKSQQTGLDIGYLTDSIITGLGRGSLKILDNLQISITDLKAKTKELGSQQEAVFYLVNQQLKTMGDYVENDGTKVKQLETDWKNLGQTIAQTFTAFSGGSIVSALDNTVKGMKLFFEALSVSSRIPGMGLLEAARAISEQEDITLKATKAVNDFKKSKQDLNSVDLEIQKLDKQNVKDQLEINQAVFEGKKGEEGQMEAYQRGILIRKKQIELLNEYKTTLELATLEQKPQLGLLEAIDEKIKQLNEDLSKATSRKQIISIQLQINEATNERADLLDPDRIARANAEKAKKGQQEIDADMNKSRGDFFKEQQKKVNSYYQWLLDQEKQNNKQFLAGLKKDLKDQEEEEAAHQQRMKRLISFAGSQLYMNTRQIMNELIQQEVQQYDERIQNLSDYYSNQEQLAGSNQKRVQKLQKEEAAKQKELEKEKKAAQKKANIEKIEIDTAANVVRSILENGGIPYGLPFGGIALAMGLAQIALVNKYAKGVIDLKGPGTETSDSIPALLSRGESVMTAEETRNSGNILKNIRAKKLNDQVLEKLTITTDGIKANFDDTNIVNELRRNKQPDLVRMGSIIYEAKEHGKNQRRIIRSKSFNP
jgi:DNA repair exonuclease SbcCD ATPase subunit